MDDFTGIFTLESHHGRYGVVRAQSLEQAEEIVRTAHFPPFDQRLIPLNQTQLSMLYAEVLGKDSCANNVIYLLQPDVVKVDDLDLDQVMDVIQRVYPITGCRVVRKMGGYYFDLKPVLPPSKNEAPLSSFLDRRACIEYFLDLPLSLFDQPLLQLFKVNVDGCWQLAVLLHHILGNHIGQLALLKAVVEAAGTGKLTARVADFSFVATNLEQLQEYQRIVEPASDDWEKRASDYAAISDVPRLPREAGYSLIQMPAPFAPEMLSTPSRLFPLLQAMAISCERVLGVQEPLVNLLFSLADHQALTGFCSYTVPLPLSRGLFGTDISPNATLAYITERLANAAIGYEEILSALGLYDFRADFLFNYVELMEDDLDWLRQHVANDLSEKPKTLLDLTLINSPKGCWLQLNSRLPRPQAEAFLECFLALRAPS